MHLSLLKGHNAACPVTNMPLYLCLQTENATISIPRVVPEICDVQFFWKEDKNNDVFLFKT